jgi:hypothetical protein
LAVGGTLRFGSDPDSLLIREARLEARNVDQLFQPIPSEDRPFQITLTGTIEFGDEGPELGVTDARFTFAGDPLKVAPKFDFGGVKVASGSLGKGLPIRVTQAGIRFIDKELPLPRLVQPSNIEISLGAEADVPFGSGNGLLARVDRVVARLEKGIPRVTLGGLGFGVDNLQLPSMSLSGVVYLGGLDGPPENLLFAGKLGGTSNGTGITCLVAFEPKRPLGVCIDVSGGSSGIPLGETGFLLTGISGGVSFANSNTDPCEFTTYVKLEADGRPRRLPTTRPAPSIGSRGGTPQPSSRPVVSGIPDCPGDCPPASMNILCQPHPDQDTFPGRAILKFSSLDEQVLEGFGLKAKLENLIGATPEQIVTTAVPELLQIVESLSPIPPEQLKTLRDVLQKELRDALQLGMGAGRTAWEIVRDRAYAGLTCLDVTLVVTATFSYTCVSSFATVTGGVTVSTAGSVGVLGWLNIFGMRVGRLRGFFTLTNATGGVDPSICGDLRFVMGPLELGNLSFRYQLIGGLTDLTDSIIRAARQLSESLVRDLLAQVIPTPTHELVTLLTRLGLGTLIVDMGTGLRDDVLMQLEPARSALQVIANEGHGNNRELARSAIARIDEIARVSKLLRNPHAALDTLTMQQASGLMARLLSTEAERINPDELGNCLRIVLEGAWNAYNPSIVLCGKVAPKLFGIPFGGDMIAVQGWSTKTELGAKFTFSPLYLLGRVFPIADLFSGMDTASFGFILSLPDPFALLDEDPHGFLLGPNEVAGFLERGFRYLLNNSLFQITYKISPLGLELLNTVWRATLPDLTRHPERRTVPWKPPEDRGANLPSRLELLTTALERGVLEDLSWRGTADDLRALEFSGERSTQGLSLTQDYFPHGGFIGAARLTAPRALVATPPLDDLSTMVDQSKPLLARAQAAARVIRDYLLRTEHMGSLAFYVPAPNPPAVLLDDPHTTVEALLDAMARREVPFNQLEDWADYRHDLAFFRGNLRGQLLGIPLGEASIDVVPPQMEEPARPEPARSEPARPASARRKVGRPTPIHRPLAQPIRRRAGFLRVSAVVDDNAWIKQIVEEVSFEFELHHAPPAPVAQRFAAFADRLGDSVTDAVLEELQTALRNDLPKVTLEASISARVPALLQKVMTGVGEAMLYAYSPGQGPPTSSNSPVERARWLGGVALRGQFQFRLGGISLATSCDLSIVPVDTTSAPHVAGQATVAQATLPGVLNLRNIAISLISHPQPGQPYLALSGTMTFGGLELEGISIGGVLVAEGISLPDSASAAFDFKLLPERFTGSFRGSFDWHGTTISLGPVYLASEPTSVDDLIAQIKAACRTAFQAPLQDLNRWATALREKWISFPDDAAKLGNALTKVFKSGAEQAAKLLRGLGYGAQQVGRILQGSYAHNAEQAVALLNRAGYATGEVVDALTHVFNASAGSAAKILRATGYAVEQVASELGTAFGQTPEQVAALLEGAGYIAHDIGFALSRVFGSSAKVAAQILKKVGYGAVEIASALKSTFTDSADDAAKILAGLGYSAAEVGDALKGTFTTSAEVAGQALKAAGYAAQEVANVMKGVYGASVDTVTKFLGTAFGLGGEAATEILKGAGYAASEVENAVKAVLGWVPHLKLPHVKHVKAPHIKHVKMPHVKHVKAPHIKHVKLPRF